MIVSTRTGNQRVEQRSRDASFLVTPGSWDAGIMGALGITEWARGMGQTQVPQELMTAAVSSAVRLVSETIGGMVMRVYEGDALQRQPVYSAPQAALFQNPSEGCSSFDFFADLAASIETTTAGIVYKMRDDQGRIAELVGVDPDFFQIRGQGYARTVVGWRDGEKVDVTRDVIVVRAWSPRPAVEGVSTLDLNRGTFKKARLYDEYTGRYFERDGTVEQVIENAPSSREGRQEMLAGWMMARRKRNIAALWGGAQLKQMSPSLQAAQGAELATVIAQEVARAFRIVPANLLYAETAPERFPSLEMVRGVFYSFSLFHRLRRIERAFAADDDLFPDKALSPGFDVANFVKADTATLATAAHDMRQDGSLTPDEERALVLGLPSLPDGSGSHIQQTPVGGAPNPQQLAPPVPNGAGALRGEVDG